MKNRNFLYFGLIFAILVIAYFAYQSLNKYEKYDREAFAKCLTKNNVVMYGAEWCSHCKAQKKMFGDSFRFVNYVECPQDVALCKQMGIRGYPTWVFSNGKRAYGEVSLEDLSLYSGCKLTR